MQARDLLERVGSVLELIAAKTEISRVRVDGFDYKACGYETGAPPALDGSFIGFDSVTDRWGGAKDKHAWFHKVLQLPLRRPHALRRVEISTGAKGWDSLNPQMLAYVDGQVKQGLDTNHTFLQFDKEEDTVELFVYAYSGMDDTVGQLKFECDMTEYDERVIGLYYDLRVLVDDLKLLESDSVGLERSVARVSDAVDLLVFHGDESAFLKSVEAARGELCAVYRDLAYAGGETVRAVGHTHIDIAWMWTVRQTREKAARSFATVLELMDRYPAYRFMSSQAVLYQMVKEDHPALFERIKRRVGEGRWEAEGAMWLEADCNLTSGESLVRQILYGKAFFRREFGIDSRVLWLPDVFGYTAALPQILKKSGIDFFVTSKISWNDTNTLPNDAFVWEGIDGSRIDTYFLTAQDYRNSFTRGTTYVAHVTPSMVRGTYERFQNKGLSEDTLITFGYGDGGGGPTETDLEYLARMRLGLPGCPKTQPCFAGEFLQLLKRNAERNGGMSVWKGELYLEYHRGTYTTLSGNKRYNRLGEYLLQDAELLCTVCELEKRVHYPKELLFSAWETLLTNQFHDILPGSSIGEVYRDSDADYKKLFDNVDALVRGAMCELLEDYDTCGKVAVFNGNSFDASGHIEIDGAYCFVDNVSAKGFKLLDKKAKESCGDVSADEYRLENEAIRVRFDHDYNIVSICDKAKEREIVSDGGYANRIVCYDEPGCQYDAWDIKKYYSRARHTQFPTVLLERIVRPGVVGFVIQKKIFHSVFIQKILLYAGEKSIDFITEVDWRDEHVLMKSESDLDINADRAVCDVQFGVVERPRNKNTAWEQAKFEVCCHKFADISEGDYGVALINDCKYGYGLQDGKLSLSLLRSPTYPYADADKTLHRFRYEIYVHEGNYYDSDVMKRAYLFNKPLVAFDCGEHAGRAEDGYGFIKVSSDRVIVDTIKKSEDGGSVIVRLFETSNSRQRIRLDFARGFSEAYETDLLENDVQKLSGRGKGLTLTVKPFEIKTVKLIF